MSAMNEKFIADVKASVVPVTARELAELEEKSLDMLRRPGDPAHHLLGVIIHRLAVSLRRTREIAATIDDLYCDGKSETALDIIDAALSTPPAAATMEADRG